MTPRYPVLLVKQAQRAAIDRALAQPLNSTELRVFLALVRLVTLFDRIEDRVSNLQLQQATGITDDRRVRRAVKRITDLGIIEREAGGSTAGGGRIASLYRFPTGGAHDPGSEEPRGYVDTRDPGSLMVATGGLHVPASEVFPEASSEVLSPAENAAFARAIKAGQEVVV